MVAGNAPDFKEYFEPTNQTPEFPARHALAAGLGSGSYGTTAETGSHHHSRK
jgi:hypothetical protein